MKEHSDPMNKRNYNYDIHMLDDIKSKQTPVPDDLDDDSPTKRENDEE